MWHSELSCCLPRLLLFRSSSLLTHLERSPVLGPLLSIGKASGLPGSCFGHLQTTFPAFQIHQYIFCFPSSSSQSMCLEPPPGEALTDVAMVNIWTRDSASPPPVCVLLAGEGRPTLAQHPGRLHDPRAQMQEGFRVKIANRRPENSCLPLGSPLFWHASGEHTFVSSAKDFLFQGYKSKQLSRLLVPIKAYSTLI